jgi:hypothetical protein
MSHTIIDHFNSKSFFNMAWIAFILATVSTLTGIAMLETDLAVKGFLAMGFAFTVSACFTLAEVTRDRHESERLCNKVARAKTEPFLSKRRTLGGISRQTESRKRKAGRALMVASRFLFGAAAGCRGGGKAKMSKTVRVNRKIRFRASQRFLP